MSVRPPISVVIVDDAELVVQGLATMLRPFRDRVEVVATAIGQVPSIDAEVLLIDGFGHADSGVDRVRESLQSDAFDHVALITWRLSADRRRQVVEAGASGVLSKSADSTEMVDAIEQMAAGETIVHEFPARVWSERVVGGSDSPLSEREAELLALTANGLSNAEVGEIMFIASSTVKTYLKTVYRKLGVTNRAQATLKAVELELVGPNADI